MSPVQQSIRRVDVDPFFDNTRLDLTKEGLGGKKRAVPYHVGNTWRKPNGDRKDYNESMKSMTAMQKHVAFFDGDCDGIIWPTDTFFAFLSLGFGLILSFLSVFIIHGPFSYPTLPSNGNRWTDWLPDPFMRIYVANIHRCKHGSDTESYNRRGQLQQQKFQDILEDYSSYHNKEALSFRDGLVMIKERRNMMDFFGIFAFIFEWGSTYMLLWPKDGYMKKDDILGVLDGSIFVVLAHKRAGAFKANIFLFATQEGQSYPVKQVTVPIFLFHSIQDQFVPVQVADAYENRLCASQSATVQYIRSTTEKHLGMEVVHVPYSALFLQGQFSGKGITKGCQKADKALILDDPTIVAVFGNATIAALNQALQLARSQE